jgi:hypothetical protein
VAELWEEWGGEDVGPCGQPWTLGASVVSLLLAPQFKGVIFSALCKRFSRDENGK